MNKKGFTLIELLTVIVIIGIVTGIGIPIYNNVRNSANEKLYQSKVKAIETAAISFAEETNQNIFNVKDLIENGKLSPDNQTGEYIDPRNNKDMKCNIVNVIYDNNNYYANLTENDVCMSEAELQNLYGMFSLHVYSDKNLTKRIDNWTSNGVVYVSYEWKSMYQGYERYNPTLTYFGNGVEDTCNNKKCFRVESNLIEDSTVSLTMDIVVDNKNISNTSSVNVRIDKEKPSLVAGSLTYSSKDLTNENVLVSFDLTDGLGSGLDSYAVATNCSDVTYEKVNDSHISKSLSNGDYYICIKDKVGNISDQSDSNKIHIDNIDKSGENISGLDVVSSKSGYNALDAIIKIDMDENTSGLKMCISETGYMKDCSFVGYASQVNHHFASYGTKYTIYVTIEDAAGNLTNKQKDYTTYTECLSENYVRKDYSDWSSCSKKCGTGTQSRTYNNVDKYTNKLCQSNVKESQNCNTMSCCSSKSITSYSGWGGCSKTCGGGTQTRTGYYTSNYDGSSCGTTTESRSCNTQSCSYPAKTRTVIKTPSSKKVPSCSYPLHLELDFIYGNHKCVSPSYLCFNAPTNRCASYTKTESGCKRFGKAPETCIGPFFPGGQPICFSTGVAPCLEYNYIDICVSYEYEYKCPAPQNPKYYYDPYCDNGDLDCLSTKTSGYSKFTLYNDLGSSYTTYCGCKVTEYYCDSGFHLEGEMCVQN